jgi:SPP1 family predicted phage head-tail adaptor
MTLLAGNMDRRITFQSFTTSKNEVNEDVKAWADLASIPTVWAQVLPLSQKEMVDASRVMTLNDKVFIVRYRADIDEKMRVVYESDSYDIHSVTEIGRREGLRIVARRVA